MAGEVGAPHAYVAMVRKYTLQDAAIGAATGPLMTYGAFAQAADAGTAGGETLVGVILDDDAAILAGVEKLANGAGAIATEMAMAKGMAGLKGAGKGGGTGVKNPCSCFVEDTQVVTPCGETSIDELREGDLILSSDIATAPVADGFFEVPIEPRRHVRRCALG